MESACMCKKNEFRLQNGANFLFGRIFPSDNVREREKKKEYQRNAETAKQQQKHRQCGTGPFNIMALSLASRRQLVSGFGPRIEKLDHH